MKATMTALMLPMSAVVVGLVVAIEASLITITAIQGGVSAETPIQGITLGLVVIGGFAALAAAIKGAHALVMFTLSCGKWFQQMNETVLTVAAHQKELDALQRWRTAIVDPSLTRSGFGFPIPVSDVQTLYRDEAAG